MNIQPNQSGLICITFAYSTKTVHRQPKVNSMDHCGHLHIETSNMQYSKTKNYEIDGKNGKNGIPLFIIFKYSTGTGATKVGG